MSDKPGTNPPPDIPPAPPPIPLVPWSLPEWLEDDPWKEKRFQKDLQFQIVRAIENDNIDLLRHLIKSGVKTNASIVLVKTPLTHAVDQSPINYEIVQMLLQAPETDPNLGDSTPWGPKALHIVAKKGDVNIANLFLECRKDCDVNIRDNGDAVPLHFAVRYGHVDMVRYLLKNSADATLTDDSGRGAFHRACEVRNFEIAKILLDLGLDVNSSDKFGWTPLFHSAFLGHIEMMNFLIDNGANVNLIDIRGKSVLDAPSYSNTSTDHLDHFPIKVTIETSFDYYERKWFIPTEFLQENLAIRERRLSYDLPGDTHLEVVKILINAGVDPATYPGDGIATFGFSVFAKTRAYLILAGNKLPANSNWTINGLCDTPSHKQWFKHQLVAQTSLKHHCRCRIRRSLSQTRDITGAIGHLPLPESLKSYLRLEEFKHLLELSAS